MTLALWLACQADTDGGGASDADATAETGETDTGSGPTGTRVFDDAHVLVVPDSEGVHFLDRRGTDRKLLRWSDVAPESCGGCTGEGASPDGDGLLVTFAIGFAGGGVARIGADGLPEWSLRGLMFPHDAVRDPADGTILVVEAAGNRFRWITGDGSSTEAVRVLDEAHTDWREPVPNGIEKLEQDGRTFVVSSNRGAPGEPGRITLWDLTDPAAPTLAWRFPEEPGLDIPHGPIVRRWAGRWWLLWAHSQGSARGGTVGLAVTDELTVRPEYVADLESDGAPFGFLRGVELTDDGRLWVTDSGDGVQPSTHSGRVLEARMPEGLDAAGTSGAVGPGQVFVPIAAEVVRDRLGTPFEGWLWQPTFPL